MSNSRTMKIITFVFLSFFALSCNAQKSDHDMKKQTELTNSKIKDHQFLECMYNDDYFPDFLVDKCKNILLNLCTQIEEKNPKDLETFYSLTHTSTNQINELQDEFFENGSEIESMARDCLALDFEYIASAYGFENADLEEMIATRDW